jgi:uncharacterized protein YggE
MASDIIVRGEGEVRALPDRARIRVAIDGDGSSQQQAYETAATVAARVDAVLAGDDNGVERVTTTALIVQALTRYHKGESQRTGWRAARTSVVEVTQLDRVGQLLADLATAGATINGPAWELDPGHVAHDDARRAAAEDARRRADAYASALGLKIDGIAWVAEPGLRMPGPGSPMSGAAYFGVARSTVALGDDEPIEVNPEEITVTASVEVGFTVTDT